jgi:hypothetical protein
MVAAKLANMKVGGKEANSANLPNCTHQVSQSDAASMLNISDRSLRTAKAVEAKAPAEVVRAVEQGQQLEPCIPICIPSIETSL